MVIITTPSPPSLWWCWSYWPPNLYHGILLGNPMPVMELLQDDEDMVFADDDMLFDLNIEDLVVDLASSI